MRAKGSASLTPPSFSEAVCEPCCYRLHMQMKVPYHPAFEDPCASHLTLIHMFWKCKNPSHEDAMDSAQRKNLSAEFCKERKTA
jgi:hypothetical protein